MLIGLSVADARSCTPAVMIKAARAQGVSVSYRHRGLPWQIVGVEPQASVI